MLGSHSFDSIHLMDRYWLKKISMEDILVAEWLVKSTIHLEESVVLLRNHVESALLPRSANVVVATFISEDEFHAAAGST